MKRTKEKSEVPLDGQLRPEEERRTEAYCRWREISSAVEGEIQDLEMAEQHPEKDLEEEGWSGEERRWGEENPKDEEPGEAP
jgi:hypothetical protein